MRLERRNHRQRAETLRRVVAWIGTKTSPVRQVPPELVNVEAGQRILKRLALRGLVRTVKRGWMPGPSLMAPATIHPVDPSERSSAMHSVAPAKDDESNSRGPLEK